MHAGVGKRLCECESPGRDRGGMSDRETAEEQLQWRPRLASPELLLREQSSTRSVRAALFSLLSAALWAKLA